MGRAPCKLTVREHTLFIMVELQPLTGVSQEESAQRVNRPTKKPALPVPDSWDDDDDDEDAGEDSQKVWEDA